MLGAQRCIDQSASPRASSEAGKFAWYPDNSLGLGEALIFFCCFSSIKGRKAGRETPRNSRLQRVAKKKHGEIPNYGPVSRKKYAGFPDYGSISKKKHRRIPDYRPIAFKRQAHFAPGGILSQARDTEKRLPIGHTRPTRSLCLYPLLSTLYSLPSTPSTHRSLLPNDSGSSASADSTQQYSVRPQR